MTPVDSMRRLRWVLLIIVVLFGLFVGLATFINGGRPAAPSRGYGEFLDDVAAGRVDRVVQVDQELTVYEGSSVYRVVVPSVLTNVLLDMQNAAARGGRTFPASAYEAQTAPDNSWVGLVLTGLLPVIVIGGFVYFMTRRAQGGWRYMALASRLQQLDEAKRLGRISAQEHADKRAEILRNF